MQRAGGGAPALAAFQEAILRRLLLADAGRDLVELAADALLPLLLAHPADFKALGGFIIRIFIFVLPPLQLAHPADFQALGGRVLRALRSAALRNCHCGTAKHHADHRQLFSALASNHEL